MCNGNQDCKDSYDYYTSDGDYYQDENYSAENTDNENNDRSYVQGGSDGVNHATASASANYLAYIIIGGVFTAFILAIVWRKRVSRPWDQG
jgi:hypothetical protein